MNMPENNYASFGKRVAADLIDGLIIGLFSYAITFIMLGTYGSFQAGKAISILSTSGIFIYWAIWESSSFQASPGKMLMGLKVIGYKGKKLDALQACGRNAAKFLSIASVFGGIVAILFHPNRKAWHDSLSGSEVIIAYYPIKRV